VPNNSWLFEDPPPLIPNKFRHINWHEKEHGFHIEEENVAA
jgi:hypothetical protein